MIARIWLLAVSLAGLSEKDVPKPVLDAVAARYPGSKPSGYTLEKEGKRTAYEVQLEKDGKDLEADFSAEGQLISEEQRIDATAVPPEVQDGLKKSKYAAWKVEGAEKVTLAGKEADPSFEVVVSKGGKTMEVLFDAKGSVLKTEPHREPHAGAAKRELEPAAK